MFIDSFLGSQVARAMVGVSFDVADAGRADSVGELEVLVVGFEARVAEAKARFAAAADLARRVRDGREVIMEAERPAAIEVLLGIERTFDETRRLTTLRAMANENRAATASPHLLPLLRRMTGLTEEEMRLHAEAVRDLRWALLEIEAAAEPPADGPVLATPADVGGFLQGLRAAP